MKLAVVEPRMYMSARAVLLKESTDTNNNVLIDTMYNLFNLLIEIDYNLFHPQ